MGRRGDAVFEAALVAQVEAFAARVRGDAASRGGVAGGPADGVDAIAALAVAELATEALLDGSATSAGCAGTP